MARSVAGTLVNSLDKLLRLLASHSGSIKLWAHLLSHRGDLGFGSQETQKTIKSP